MKKLILLIFIIGLIIFGFPKLQKDNSNVSAGFVPGDVFYFLDTSWEWVQLNLLTFTDEGKIKLEIKYLNERIAEIKKIQRKGELTVKKAEKIMDDYNNLMKEINQNMKKIKNTKENTEELVQKIQNLSERNRSVIEQVAKEAPEKTAEYLNKAMNFGDELYQKTEKIFK